MSPPSATVANDVILEYHSTPEQAAGVFSKVAPRLAVYTRIVDQVGAGPQGLTDRTRAAGYNGLLEVEQDMTLIEIGDSIQVLHCPPVLTAVTNGAYQAKISAETP